MPHNGSDRPKTAPSSDSPSAGEPGGARARMADVAQAAGVALATVSRALNAPGKVKPATLNRIRQAIDELGYVPNLTAGSLASRRSQIVGAIVPTLSNLLFGETIDGLSSVLAPCGYQLLIGQSGYCETREAALVDAFLGRGVDAIMLTGTTHGRGVRQRLRHAGIPVVETWELTPHPIDMVVGFSNLATGQAVAAYLASKAYAPVGYLGTSEERSSRRMHGFLNECQRLGCPAHVELVHAPSTLHDGELALARLLERVPDLRAVFCSNDGMAIGALTQCRRLGLAVPSRMAVVGFSDTAMAQAYTPTISSVHHQRTEIGVRAGEMLLQRLQGMHGFARCVDLGFRIVERESS